MLDCKYLKEKQVGSLIQLLKHKCNKDYVLKRTGSTRLSAILAKLLFFLNGSSE